MRTESTGITRDKVSVENLTGIPETLLITLYNRAVESQREDAILRDEKAVAMVEQIDYDFSRFGQGHIPHAIRARVIDGWVQQFLRRHPHATVVNLGVGLGTQSERLDNGQAHWVDLDVPESIALRRQFFEPSSRHAMFAQSMMDFAWMDEIAPERPTFFVAAGVLMFFEKEAVQRLFWHLAERFPGAEMAFDVIPPWLAEKSREGQARFGEFALPLMPWGLNYNRIREIEGWHERIVVLARRDYTKGFRRRWGLIGLLGLIPPLRNRFQGTLVHLRFRKASRLKEAVNGARKPAIA